MVSQKKDWINLSQAIDIVNLDSPQRGYSESLFINLISEGLLSRQKFYSRDGVNEEGVRFSYQRLSDYLIAKKMLDDILSEDLDEINSSETPLLKLISLPV